MFSPKWIYAVFLCFFIQVSLSQEQCGGKEGQPFSELPPPPAPEPCKYSERPEYRTFDGTCNHPLDYGKTHKGLKRYVPQAYQDGQQTPRTLAVSGSPLPSARLISTTIHPDQDHTQGLSLFVMQMGQFLDHDFAIATMQEKPIPCTRCCGKAEGERFEACFPIDVPSDDARFGANGCMEFVRSRAVHDQDGNLVLPREQTDGVTSFVDTSIIYGSSQEKIAALRTNIFGGAKGALLRTNSVYGRQRLPIREEDECVKRDTEDSYCQLTGDDRADEQPFLGAMHTLFHRFHNYVVRSLVGELLKSHRLPVTESTVGRYLRDSSPQRHEKLFQEARKMVMAIFQKIAYCDWLPIVIGPELVTKYDLGCEGRSAYDETADPRIANGFSTAAFRFGHSLIPGQFKINGTMVDLKFLFEVPDNSLTAYENNLKSLLSSGSQSFDRFVSDQVTDHLFEPARGVHGALDLVSLNIQRGRDHGLAPFYQYQEYYNIESDGFASEQLSQVYEDPRDVDLFTGGLTEPPVNGGLVGEVFGNIIANQFADIKFGDFYFFTTSRQPQYFTDAQLEVIKQVDLATVICNESEIDIVQQNPFFDVSATNPPISCSSREPIDFSQWLPNLTRRLG